MTSVNSILKWAGAACLLLASLTACGGDGSGGSSASAGSGTLQVAITDATTTTYNSVVIAIREVRAVPSGAENSGEGGLPLVVAFNPPKVIDVLDLAYQQQLLGEATIPDGGYTQLRLVLADNVNGQPPANYLILEDDLTTRIPLKTPSGQESGLKVLGDFVVAAGEITAIVLDFDPTKAIVQAGASGNWLFKPTGIRIVQVEDLLASYGALAGTVLGGTGGFTPVTTARVSAIAQTTGTVVAAGAVNPDDATFRLLLPAGSFELRATANGYATYTSLPTRFPVTLGADTYAGNLVMTPAP